MNYTRYDENRNAFHRQTTAYTTRITLANANSLEHYYSSDNIEIFSNWLKIRLFLFRIYFISFVSFSFRSFAVFACFFPLSLSLPHTPPPLLLDSSVRFRCLRNVCEIAFDELWSFQGEKFKRRVWLLLLQIIKVSCDLCLCLSICVSLVYLDSKAHEAALAHYNVVAVDVICNKCSSSAIVRLAIHWNAIRKKCS